jgi:hypothetical protein
LYFCWSVGCGASHTQKLKLSLAESTRTTETSHTYLMECKLCDIFPRMLRHLLFSNLY